MSGNVVAQWGEGAGFEAFMVTPGGALRCQYGNPPTTAANLTADGVFDPDTPISVGRVRYDPANGFYALRFVAGRYYQDHNQTVIAWWDGDEWRTNAA